MNALQRTSRAESPEDSPGPASVPPVYVPYPAAAPARGGISLATVALAAILGLIALMVAAFLLMAASMLGAGGRTVGEVGQRAGDAARSAGEAAGRVGQDVRDRFDAEHPPRMSLAYDAEIDDFLKLGVGQPLTGGRTRSYTLTAIRSRQDGDRPETSRFAVIHAELRQPNETKVLGVTVRRDADPHDYPVYQGEAFRIGPRVYKVNWISAERQQVALVALRDPDRAAVSLKFVDDD